MNSVIPSGRPKGENMEVIAEVSGKLCLARAIPFNTRVVLASLVLPLLSFNYDYTTASNNG